MVPRYIPNYGMRVNPSLTPLTPIFWVPTKVLYTTKPNLLSSIANCRIQDSYKHEAVGQ